MRKSCIVFFVGCAFTLTTVAFAADMNALFPEIAPWISKDKTAVYEPLNLFEYIDGAADNFLAYDFLELAVHVYEDAGKHQLTAEIYHHSSALNAFGIYSSEKPLHGDYLAIGAQGYYEQGVLNFCSGPYYVKLSGFDLGAHDRAVLIEFAGAIARRIGVPAALPAELQLLPTLNRKPESERFILTNFLGHPFLSSALVADYDSGATKFQLFVMLAADAATAKTTLQRYATLDKSLAGKPLNGDELTLQDPYNGPVRLLRRGPYLTGGLNMDNSMWMLYRAEFIRLLPENR